MQIFFLITLFLFWLLFWSFASVIIHRLKSWEKWILTGRSHCWSCNKLLQALDLIPLFSWLISKWKCRQCNEKVSVIYPILELSTWLLFTWVWYFLINYKDVLAWDIFIEIPKLIIWLLIAFITIIYFYYDILFLEISERVLAVWVITASIYIWLASYTPFIFDTTNFWLHWSFYTNWHESIILQTITLTVIIWGLYTIILKWLSEIWDTIILIALWGVTLWVNYYILQQNNNTFESPIINWLLGALGIFTFFFIQIVVSGWKWMWQWDLRIAIFVWLLLWTSLAFPAMMITYMIWSVIWISLITYQKITKKGSWDFGSQIPFWPFIAAWFFVTVFFNEFILSFMQKWFYL